MKICFHKAWLGVSVITGMVAIITLAAFTGNPQQHQDRAIANLSHDTVPEKKSKKVTREPGDRDLDYELRKLDDAREKLEEVDWDKIKRDIESSMKNIDLEKIRLQAQESMAKVDMKKLQEQLEESFRKIDLDKMKAEIDKANEFDKEKLFRELEEIKKKLHDEFNSKEWKKEIEKMQHFNQEELNKELEKAKKEIDRAKEEINLEKLDLKKELEKAHVEIGKTKEELKGYQEMIYDMEKAGLLSTKEDYTIEYKNGDLLINGKKQSEDVTNKYRKYFKKDKVKIRKEDGEFNINHGSSDIHID